MHFGPYLHRTKLNVMWKDILCSLFLLISFVSIGQDKYEKEVRIQKTEVPKAALDFVDALQPTRKVKWYKEIGLETTSLEAKTKRKKRKLSIEFSPTGAFLDLEILTKLNRIPESVRNTIESELSDRYEKFSVQRIQEQYTGELEKIKALFQFTQVKADPELHYEIVVTARVEGVFKSYEYLFDARGTYVKHVHIIHKMTDNIEY
jgi:hypothetical protein